jgi:hypothetical protein
MALRVYLRYMQLNKALNILKKSRWKIKNAVENSSGVFLQKRNRIQK